MIELKDIKKTYKSKKGLSTEALKGVSINFAEKGLTFILGKSGSGKSTLLNILGGLDNYTSGDIIINGKSTKDFKEKEWDAYRNTYMGFVFQEFNLLDNYTIEDNIKLALELQHKEATSQEILEALKEVDLEDVLKRKPNELSGGQKQRVAIARALIKNPEIILLDEPTGNLDSTTSTQIFEILKKMSKNKLVVVVSHDEESAKKYADRIIKISDGLVESDNGNDKIKENKNFKLVNAKLPFFYSFKMGLGNLLHKKIRLFFSIVLIILCLVCFGTMISTLNTDVNEEYIRIFEEKGSTEISIQKFEEKVVYEDIFEELLTHMFDMDLSYMEEVFPKTKELDNKFLNEIETKTKMNWHEKYTFTNNDTPISWVYDSVINESAPIYYYIGSYPIIEFVKFDDDLKNNIKLIGNAPINNDEIVISNYVADEIIYNGIKSKTDLKNTKTEKYKPTSYDQIINDNVYVNLGDYTYVKIVGIADYSEKTNKYAELKEIKESAFWDMMDYTSDEYKKIDKMWTELSNEAHTTLNAVYVSDSFITKLDYVEENMTNTTSKIVYNNKSFDVNQFGYLNKEVDVYDGNSTIKKSSLNENEIIINASMLNTITDGDYYKKLENFLIENMTTYTDYFFKNYIKTNNIIGKSIKSGITKDKLYSDESNFVEYKIVGVINDKSEFSQVYYNQDLVKKHISDNLVISTISREVTNVEDLKTILNYYPINNSTELSSSAYSEELLMSLEMSALFKLVGRYGTIFFLIFASFILMNFISTSIKYRKKEIGILRAIGCRSIDVIKMFMYECLSLMVICLVISFAIIPKITTTINNFMSDTLYTKMNVMNFGILQIFGVTLIMILIVVLASIIPIRKLTKMKPIDTILDK